MDLVRRMDRLGEQMIRVEGLLTTIAMMVYDGQVERPSVFRAMYQQTIKEIMGEESGDSLRSAEQQPAVEDALGGTPPQAQTVGASIAGASGEAHSVEVSNPPHDQGDAQEAQG